MTEEETSNPMLRFTERLAVVETKVGTLEVTVSDLKKAIDRLDQKIWAILSGVVVSIALIILTRLL